MEAGAAGYACQQQDRYAAPLSRSSQFRICLMLVQCGRTAGIIQAVMEREESVPSTEEDKTAKTREMLSDLYQLVEALDRRVPHIERLGEAQIARDAADLRERAVSLIQRIEGTTPKA